MSRARLLTALSASMLSVATQAAPSTAHLRAQIAGVQADNRWFLCLPSENGCFSLQAASKGQVFPIEPGRLKKVILLNTKEHSFDTAMLPKSCDLTIQPNQTLQIKGQLHTGTPSHARIEHLECHLSKT